MRKPLDQMKIRNQDVHNTYGKVRTYANGAPKPHQGWDLYAPVGTPVYAIANGVVRSITETPLGIGLGLQLTLEFMKDGKILYARYGHLSSVSCNQGDGVYEGQMLGRSGTSRNADGMTGSNEHLHFEIDTQPVPVLGLAARMDPGEVLGYQYYFVDAVDGC